MRRMIVALVLVSTILLTANAVACSMWLYFAQVNGSWKWEILTALLTIAFVPATLLGFRTSPIWLRIVYAASAIWLGIVNFCFFAAIICWGIFCLIQLSGWSFDPFHIVAFLFGMALLTAVYGVFNAMRIRVKHITVKLPNLPSAWQGSHVALVTDLHLGHISGSLFLRHVLSILQQWYPEAVFISGDLFDGTTARLEQLAAPWREFQTLRGIYYVTGNHDEFGEHEKYLNAVRSTGIHILQNEKVTIHGLQLIGIHDEETRNPARFREILKQVQLDRQQPSILLSHRPENLSIAEEEGVSLQLSGHTHGGQFWPWNWVVSRIYGRFAYGLNQLGKLQVYTSSGTGTWGPPLRVGTTSEIVLIQLETATPTSPLP